jgi:hypothetical protein
VAPINPLRQIGVEIASADVLSRLPRATSRFTQHRVVPSAAWCLGKAHESRGRFGSTPTESQIAVQMADYQHSQSCLFAGEFEPVVSTLSSALARPGDTVFDVDAHARACGHSGRRATGHENVGLVPRKRGVGSS